MMFTLKQIHDLPEGLHCDGNNLYVRKRGGSSSWIFRFRWEGKTHDIGLGSLARVPPYEARKKAALLHTQIYNGVHPLLKAIEDRREKSLLSTGARLTLRGIAVEALTAHANRIRPKTKDYVNMMVTRLENSVFQTIGDTGLALLTPKKVADALRPYWDGGSGPNIAAGLRVCFNYAVASGAISESPFTKANCTDIYLPVRKHKVNHRKAIAWTDMPALYAKVLDGDTVYHRMLCLAMLTVPRIGDLVKMKTSDYDAGHATLTVRSPKVGDEFVIPLPRQAVGLLSPGKTWLFEEDGRQTRAHMCLRTLQGIEDATVHGFRATFSMWCADNGKDSELRERCLQHTVGSKVTAAYQRSDLRERRRALLQEWSDYVTSSPSASRSS